MDDLKLNNTFEFNQFIGGCDSTYSYNFGITITEGVKYLAETYECYWFIDMICIHSQALKTHEFQVWNLKRVTGYKFLITAEDGNKTVLTSIHVKFSDFKSDDVDVWLVNNVILLPNEY